MKVSDLFSLLSYGEFSNIALGLEGAGGIEEASKPKVVIAANEALRRIYSRFVLSEKDVVIEMVSHITNYHLLKKFAESGFDPEQVRYPYIKDLGREPFEEDAIKILAVYDSLGCQMSLNDSGRLSSLFTPQPTVLQVPRPIQGVSLSVNYQAAHPQLALDDEEQEIVLPPSLHGALTAYVAYKVFSSMGTEGSGAKAQEHQSMYEAICHEVADMDLVNASISTTNTRFEQRGWV